MCQVVFMEIMESNMSLKYTSEISNTVYKLHHSVHEAHLKEECISKKLKCSGFKLWKVALSRLLMKALRH